MKIEGKLLGEKTALRSYRKSDLDFVSGIWFDGENGKYLSDPEKEFIDEKFQRAVDGLEDSPLGFYFVAELEETGGHVLCVSRRRRDGLRYRLLRT